MTNIKLSPRMQAIADMAKGKIVADIGCDHAFVSIYLVKEKGFEKAFAMDVKKGPLEIAKKNINLYGLGDKIDIRLSNGFEKLKPMEADTAVIAGMGGALMVDILKNGKVHTDNKIKLILQPQSEPEKVRKYLSDINYVIIDERMLIDEDKYYTVIKAVSYEDFKGEAINGDESLNASYSEYELLYGRILIKKKDDILKQYLEERIEKNAKLIDALKKAGTENALEKQSELEHENTIINQALEIIKR